MRADYNVLYWRSDGPLDVQKLKRDYLSGAHDGLFLRFTGDVRVADLDFLLDIQELRYVEIDGRVEDDSHAFRIPGLRELVLLTRSQVAIPAASNASLHSLAVDDRAGEVDLSTFTGLAQVTIWGSGRRSLEFLGTAPRLTYFKLEGVGQAIDLSGISKCVALRDLEILEACVDSLSPLRELVELRRCWLLGRGNCTPSEPLDFAHLLTLRNLAELRVTNAGTARSVAPLLELESLRDLRLRGTRILAEDSALLDGLRGRVRIVAPDE